MQQLYHTAVHGCHSLWLFQNGLVTITPGHSKSLVNVCKPFASGVVKQKLHQLTEQEKLYGVLKWGMTTSEKTFIGEGKVGDYTLSQDFIDAIRTNLTWAQYDEDELNTAGYAHTQD